jgi:hypothetical protein
MRQQFKSNSNDLRTRSSDSSDVLASLVLASLALASLVPA